MRCRQCNHPMQTSRTYAVCTHCNRLINFRTRAIRPGNPLLAGADLLQTIHQGKRTAPRSPA